MTEPTRELDVDEMDIPVDEDKKPAPGEPILEALEKLTDRVDRLQSSAQEAQARAGDLEEALNRIQDTAGRQTPEGVEEEFHRLTGLDAEKKRWVLEREMILKTVEGIIQKVDSLEKQL